MTVVGVVGGLLSPAFEYALRVQFERVLRRELAQLCDVEIRLRELHQFCDGCDCSRAQCDRWVAAGCIACCPDCIHRWART